MSENEVFEFLTPKNNRYIAEFHSDWPLREDEKDTAGTRLGIDVSVYQGNIDFEKVKEDGYDFVIVRIGFRGYGSAGNIKADERAITNITKAKEAGLDVGVYFFSQAINETEAVEEADFCFDIFGCTRQ